MPLIRFSPSTLEWIGYYDPKLDSTMSTAHWAPEPNTDNMLNYHIKVDMCTILENKGIFLSFIVSLGIFFSFDNHT